MIATLLHCVDDASIIVLYGADSDVIAPCAASSVTLSSSAQCGTYVDVVGTPLFNNIVP